MEDIVEVNNQTEVVSTPQIRAMSEYDRSQYPQLLDGVMRVEREAWPEEWRATREKFESRLKVFPEGFFVAFKDNEMSGVSTSEIVHYYPQELPSNWDAITDDGYIRSTHKPSGNALYVVSVGVSQRFQGQGIGRALVEGQKQLAQKLNLRYLFLGSRIPKYQEYHASHSDVSAEGYVKLENEEGKKLDPELRFYESCGLKTVKVVPNYGPDPKSENYGVVMVWENPDINNK